MNEWVSKQVTRLDGEDEQNEWERRPTALHRFGSQENEWNAHAHIFENCFHLKSLAHTQT